MVILKMETWQNKAGWEGIAASYANSGAALTAWRRSGTERDLAQVRSWPKNLASSADRSNAGQSQCLFYCIGPSLTPKHKYVTRKLFG